MHQLSSKEAEVDLARILSLPQFRFGPCWHKLIRTVDDGDKHRSFNSPVDLLSFAYGLTVAGSNKRRGVA